MRGYSTQRFGDKTAIYYSAEMRMTPKWNPFPVPADYLKKSDYVIKLDSETWAGLYINAISLNDSIDSGHHLHKEILDGTWTFPEVTHVK
jgi:hypothetical protein